MRRVALLAAAAAAAAPLLTTAPADASITCASPFPNVPFTNRQPVCAVWCAAKLDLSDPCWIQD